MNEIGVLLNIAAITVLVALNLATVSAQTALLQTSLPRLLSWQEQHSRRLSATIDLIQASLRVQAGLNLARLILRFFLAGMILVIFWQQLALASVLAGLGVLLLSAVLLYWMELLVQTAVLCNPTEWAIRTTLFTRIIGAIMSPLVHIAQFLSGSQQSLPEMPSMIAVSEDDLRNLVDAGQQEGNLEAGERKMILSIFELGSTLAREIMVPRIDMLALDVLTPLPQAVDAFLKTGHSRVPVYEDTIDNILGLLYAKDLLQVWRKGEELDSLRPLLRRAYFVPEAKKVDELMAEMQRQRVHMAIVVDEYGGIAGLVTLEDIVEEILGEIMDEYDQAEELPYEEVAPGEFIFLGRIDLDDFNEIMNSNLPKEEADTLAGFIYNELGRVPASGESVQVGNLLLEVEQVSGRRIRKVRVQGIQPVSSGDERLGDVNE